VIVVLFACSVLGLFDWRDLRPGRNASVARVDTWEVPAHELNARRGVSSESARLQPGVAREVIDDEDEDSLDDRARLAELDGTETKGPPERPVRVYVTNGCGLDRLAARFRPLLQEAGFDVCGVTNADRKDYQETLIVDRSGRPGGARSVYDHFQTTYGVGRLVLQTRSSSPEGDVLVILGSDLTAAFGSAPR